MVVPLVVPMVVPMVVTKMVNPSKINPVSPSVPTLVDLLKIKYVGSSNNVGISGFLIVGGYETEK